jgi:hypothetical protein
MLTSSSTTLGRLWSAQVAPRFVVPKTAGALVCPLLPTASHVVAVGQARAVAASFVGRSWVVHVAPPFVVPRAIPWEEKPTASQVVAVAQAMASSDLTPAGRA